MNDFLGRLAARAQGVAAVVKPPVRSRYEPGGVGPPPVSEGWGEEVAEAAGRKDGTDGEDGGGRPEAAAVPSLEAPGERRVVSRPAEEVLEPRPAVPRAAAALPLAALEAPSPAPVKPPLSSRREARRAAPALAAPPALEVSPALAAPAPEPGAEPAPSRAEPRIARRVREAAEPALATVARTQETHQPGPVEPAADSPAAKPMPPRRGAGRPAELLPTVGPRRGMPDLSPVPAGMARPAGETEEVVRVSIGRIDVHAGPPPAKAPAPRAPAGPRLSLADYLKTREERRRR
jgi:hypothetical protein